jgi:hypothetical protein
MSEKSAGKSHVWVWALSLIALPVLYVLSWPWISIWVSNSGSTSNATYRTCSEPWVWLTTKSPLLMPLSRYQVWCWEVAYPGSILKDE